MVLHAHGSGPRVAQCGCKNMPNVWAVIHIINWCGDTSRASHGDSLSILRGHAREYFIERLKRTATFLPRVDYQHKRDRARVHRSKEESWMYRFRLPKYPQEQTCQA